MPLSSFPIWKARTGYWAPTASEKGQKSCGNARTSILHGEVDMDRLPNPLAPTAQFPLMTGFRLEFAKALQTKVSPFALTRLFPDLIRDLEKHANFQIVKLEDTLKVLGQVGGLSVAGDVWDLFHSIPRNVLESIVLGTIAYDDCRTSGNGRVTGLSGDGPGVYVLGLSIAGRQGEFISAKELRLLLDNLDTYILGYKFSSSQSSGPQKPPDKAARAADLVAKVDSAYGAPPTPGKPRFICDDANLEAAQCLYKWLNRTYLSLRQRDPTGEIRMIQSPLYVGCGRNVTNRITDYELCHNKTALCSANKFYGLIASLLNFQGLTPKVHIATAIRTWQTGQLPKAEMLVAALAGSYVTHGGFNLREAGQTRDTQIQNWPDHEAYVFSAVTYLRDNAMWSIRDLDRAAQLQENEAALEVLDKGTLHREADGCIAGLEATRVRCLSLDQEVEQAESELIRAKDDIAALSRQRELLAGANEILDRLLMYTENLVEDDMELSR
ncbi:hypothetical protein MFIFM68171_07003 [Madurella fahalii]|uniref:Uncharacterized protein n=1 Tax=Madurella fahalii TaxID=1157608 RepID=A0ABQ0GGB7_9PEZI